MLKAGQMFGNYRIVEKIGVGGMGSVYLAEHPAIGKQVALKVIHPELSANKEVITRFFNEARAANQIGNDHIVDIHDFGQTDDGEHFYIMEFLEGRTLAQVLTQSPTLNPQRVLHIVAQMAAGLDAAHSRNIIHRDLKPDNVILVNRLGDADFVKILDFGLAKVLDAEQKLTAVGVVLGTPQYMSPEACESRRDIDHRADIYALGILMFQMLCGRVPFQGETMGEVLIRQVTKLPPAPRGFNPAIPPSVEQIVLRCLAKDREARFPSMLELRKAALAPEQYLASSPPVVQSAGMMTSEKPRATQFFSGGAPGNQPGTAPPELAAGLGPAPSGQRTAFLGSEGGSLIKTLPPVDPSAPPSITVPPNAGAVAAHAQKTHYSGESSEPLRSAPQPAHAQKTQYTSEASEPIGSAPPPPAHAGQPAHSAKTAFMSEPGGGPPPDERNKRASVKTEFMAPNHDGGAAAIGHPSAASAAAKTAFMSPPLDGPSRGASEAATQFLAPSGAVGAPLMAPPGLSPPTPAHNHTMAIAPPPGYKEHPPRSASPVWIAVGAALAVAAFVGFGFVWPGFLLAKEGKVAGRGKPDAAAKIVAAPVPIDAAPVERADAAPKKAAVARIELQSDPSGATVLDEDGGVLVAKTPGSIEVPISEDEIVLVFQHRSTIEQRTTVVPSGDARVRLELPLKKASRGKRGGKGGNKKPKDKDGTLKPSFD